MSGTHANAVLVPNVIEQKPGGERAYDLYSRLLEDRIVFLGEEVNSAVANTIIAQLLFLENNDPDKDISLYINSPGGSVTAGFAILDTMNFIKCDVSTICIGCCASMASVILANGSKGKRYSLPNSEVLIHQPMGGVPNGTQETDMAIVAEQMKKTRNRLNEILAKQTGKDIETIQKDTERDNWMTADEAKEYGLIDEVLSTHTSASK